MSVNSYDVGDQVRITATFKNRSGVEADPSTITFKYLKPGGTVQSDNTGGAVVNDSTGVYHYDLTLDTAGFWKYRWEGTGNLVAAEDNQLYVEESELA